ncbi:MAG: PqqD family protein [Bacteroidota bacterium]
MKLKKNIAISETGFIFNPNTGDSFSLNPIATEMLSMIKDGKQKDEIQSFILGKYDVDAITFEKNFSDFISMLNQFSLFENDNEN